MDAWIFVALAYGITGLVLAVLCVSSVLRARAAARQLDVSARHES